jgi:hypothetical protein
MSTSAATIHLRNVKPSALEAALDGLNNELELKAKIDGSWTSLHADDPAFIAGAAKLALQLSKALGTVAVSFVLFDDSAVTCSTFAKGLKGESLSVMAGQRTKFDPAAWKRAGLDTAKLERLAKPFQDVTEAAMLLAGALKIPTRTVLVDDVAQLVDEPAPKARPAAKPKLDPALAKEWAKLERDAKASGVSVPSFQEFLEMQGDAPDSDDVRGMIHLLRTKFIAN